MIFVVSVQGEHRKRCLSTRGGPVSTSFQVEKVALERRTEEWPKSQMWLSLFLVLLLLGLLPLDCFPSNTGSFGASWTA